MMTLGMLWFDNSPKDSLAVKISRAADYYAKKYERKPDFAFVHPSMLEKAEGLEDISVTVTLPPCPAWLYLDRDGGSDGR